MTAPDPQLDEAFPGVSFTPVEKLLLSYLFGTQHRYADKGELLREVWGYSAKTRTRTVQTTIQRVRAKIEPDPSKPTVLLNVRGRGYQLHPPGKASVEEELDALRARLAQLIGSGQTIVAVLTADTVPGASLPAERDTWIGRTDVVTEAAELLEGGAQWLTILGGPGVGKTRLATRIARGWVDNGKGEAWFCDLSGARTVDAFWSQLARVLGVVAVGASQVDDLVLRALSTRSPGLLVLDNVEQLADVVAEALPSLQSASPHLQVIATSRERLRAVGEHVLSLDPLDDADGRALFAARAAVARPGISLDDDIVGRIVRRLDGLPLALELAAARVRFTPLEQLADRLEERIGELMSDRRQVTERQSSLSHAIAWSWELLSADEQRILAELSVFRGGAPMEAVEAVCSAGAESQRLAVALIDKSMLRAESSPTGARFSCLESVREFARDHVEHEVLASAAARHAAWFTLHAEGAAAAYDTSPSSARFLLDELDNLLAAHDHLVWLAVPQAAALASHMWHVHLTHGQPPDYLRRLNATLAMPGLEQDPRTSLLILRIDVLTLLDDHTASEALVSLPTPIPNSFLDLQRLTASIHVHQSHGDSDKALATALRAADLAAQGGWPLREAKLEIAAGAALQLLFRMDDALSHYRRAVTLATDLGADRIAAVAWGNIGACLDDPAEREEALSRAEALARSFDDRAVLHSVKSVRASRYLEAGELETADALYHELFDDVDRMGGRSVTGSQRVNAGLLSLTLGRWVEGVTRLTEARRRIGDRGQGVIWTMGLAYLGVAHARAGQEAEARAVFIELGAGDPELGPQIAMAVRLCRAHVPGLEDVDGLLAEAKSDPALASLVQLLEQAR